MSDVLAAHYKEAVEAYKERLCNGSGAQPNPIDPTFENFTLKGNEP